MPTRNLAWKVSAMATFAWTTWRAMAEPLWSVREAEDVLLSSSSATRYVVVVQPWDARAHHLRKAWMERNNTLDLFDARSAASSIVLHPTGSKAPVLLTFSEGKSYAHALVDERIRADALAESTIDAFVADGWKKNETFQEALLRKREKHSIVSLIFAGGCRGKKCKACEQLEAYVEGQRSKTDGSILYVHDWEEPRELLDEARLEMHAHDRHGWYGQAEEKDAMDACFSSCSSGRSDEQDLLSIMHVVYFLGRKPSIQCHVAREDGMDTKIIANHERESGRWRLIQLLPRELRFPFILPVGWMGSTHPSFLVILDRSDTGRTGILSRELLRVVDRMAGPFTDQFGLDIGGSHRWKGTCTRKNGVCSTRVPYLSFYYLDVNAVEAREWLDRWFEYTGDVPAVFIIEPVLQEYYLLETMHIASSHDEMDMERTLQDFLRSFLKGHLRPHRRESDHVPWPELHPGLFLRNMSPSKIEHIYTQGWETLVLYTSNACALCKRYKAMFELLESILLKEDLNASLGIQRFEEVEEDLKTLKRSGNLILCEVDCDRYNCGMGIFPSVYLAGLDPDLLLPYHGSPWLKPLLQFLIQKRIGSSTQRMEGHT